VDLTGRLPHWVLVALGAVGGGKGDEKEYISLQKYLVDQTSQKRGFN
jgi:hypothetical protein